ncbi:MAG: methylmalonyl-CoA mutase family protein [Halieaceae bacterium]|nr:methylmalonyl-CoA mutase family protein [Halieaceae bacterium]
MTKPKGNKDCEAPSEQVRKDSIEGVKVALSRTKTWGGMETREFYSSPHIDSDPYHAKNGEPGQYPYTRGIRPSLYRKRMWTLRNIVGYGSPEDTCEGIREALRAGTAGINVVIDALSQQSIDPDHPAFGVEVGAEGCSLPSARDMQRLLGDIDITRSGVAFHSTMMTYPLVAAAAIRQGKALDRIMGSHMPDHLQLNLSGWGNELVPADLCHKTSVDCIEYCIRNSPKWALGFPQGYDLRERGLPPHGEIAVGMAIVNKTLEDLLERGLSIDEVAPNLAWVSSADIDFFEEVAKFRALRRLWARTMKERFGARNERSMALRIACHTAGNSLVYQQPLNNLARAAIESLAALCGGVQSLETCTYDEPVCIPTAEARELATRTQQILANEVGAARTADPLGGSYYVEALTDRIEEEARATLSKLEEIGLLEAISNGTIEQICDQYNMDVERELQQHERVIVGVNAHQPEQVEQPERFTFDRSHTEAHIRRFIQMKRERNQEALHDRIITLYQVAKQGGNFHQAMIDALLSDGSIGEVWGTVRVAHGYSYDPFNVIQTPFVYGA